MRKIINITIITLAVIMSASAQEKVGRTLGVVSAKSGTVCFQTANRDLKSGDTVTVVFTERKQSIIKASIAQKLDKSCAEMADEQLSFYSLNVTGKTSPYTAIGVVGAKISLAKGVASGDVNGDGKADAFRECTSREGVHFTVWSGKPLTGRRLWHDYYYLGYDTQPTCKNAETK